MVSFVIAKSNKNLCLKLNVIKILFRAKIFFEKSMKTALNDCFCRLKIFWRFYKILHYFSILVVF